MDMCAWPQYALALKLDEIGLDRGLPHIPNIGSAPRFDFSLMCKIC